MPPLILLYEFHDGLTVLLIFCVVLAAVHNIAGRRGNFPVGPILWRSTADLLDVRNCVDFLALAWTVFDLPLLERLFATPLALSVVTAITTAVVILLLYKSTSIVKLSLRHEVGHSLALFCVGCWYLTAAASLLLDGVFLWR